MRRRPGLTLLELTAVMVIMAVLAGAAVLKLGWRLRTVQWQDVLEQVEQADRSARLISQQTGEETELVLDLTAATIARMDRASRQLEVLHPLPSGFGIEQVRLDANTSFGGRVEVPIDPNARSASYAVKVSGPEKRSMWIIFAGLSGEARRTDDDDEVQAVFRSLSSSQASRRDDAH